MTTAPKDKNTQAEAKVAEPADVEIERSDVSRDHEVLPGSIEDPTPVERALATGTKRDVLDPQVPTGQTPEQIADELVPPDSNIELRKAAEKRAGAKLVLDDEPQGRSAAKPSTTDRK